MSVWVLYIRLGYFVLRRPSRPMCAKSAVLLNSVASTNVIIILHYFDNMLIWVSGTYRCPARALVAAHGVGS